MKEENLTLENPFYAYLFGLIQTDGHLSEDSRNRGRLSIEFNKRDEALLLELQKRLPFNSTVSTRTRKTNFSPDYTSVVWNVFDKRFRDFLVQNGLPSGRKSKIVFAPVGECSKVDYFRGLIDGDGSLGLTASGFPFLSFVTASAEIRNEYLSFLGSVTNKTKTTKANARDKVFNIAVYKEDAQTVVRTLYYPNCLALPRKLEKANTVLSWQRPSAMKKIENRKFWTASEDDFILSNSVEEAITKLDRSRNSIEMRLWRLRSDRQQVTA